MPEPRLARRLLAELLGSAGLAMAVVGSGIAAQRLSPGDVGLQLLENAAATALALPVLIWVFGPVSGAHLNPVVSFLAVPGRTALAYLPAQVAGCCAGALLANAMFDLDLLQLSGRHRASGAHWLAEAIATAGLVIVIFSLQRSVYVDRIPVAVGAYIGAAYFVTSSTSFANPAITVGRMLSDTFAGIEPASVPGFLAAQIVGAGLGWCVVRVLHPVAGPA